MLRVSLWTALVCSVVLSTATSSPVLAQGSYVGIYADSLGTTPCVTVSPPAVTTLYIIAKLDTAEVSGITGTEYRIEVTQPSGWFLIYNGPSGTGFGNPLDTLPDSADTSGLLIAFGTCRTPVGNRVSLGTITVMNFGQGERTELRVRRHSLPSNPHFQCPLFTLCDYEQTCMGASTEAPCWYSKPSAIASIGPADPIKFVFILDVAPGSEGKSSTLVSKPAIVDMVGSMEGYAKSSVILSDADSTIGFWDFDDGGTCDTSGWEEADNREVDFGEWGRLYDHVTDNDECTENTTCAWLWSDDITPWVYNDPSMAFGPGGYVVHSWLDNTIISPWRSLRGNLPVGETVLTFREFGGNVYEQSRIKRGYSVRGKTSSGSVSSWQDGAWADLGQFTWVTRTEDISGLVEPNWDSLQVRFRVVDDQLFGADPPSPLVPGPGPFLDDIRIGRPIHEAPVIMAGDGDTRWQAQDAFPSSSTAPYSPTTSRFGTSAFSRSGDLKGNDFSVIRGDSIAVEVTDAGHGTINTVRCFFSIVDGVHAGKVPPGATATAGGLFEWPATRVDDKWFVDPPDNYFRGGDIVHYFWWAVDDNQVTRGVSSSPRGITELSIETYTLAQAEAATGGLFEVSFLPTIAWEPTYVARVQADAEGDVEPTQAEIDSSEQRNCVLYVNKVNTERRSSDVTRTSFMYTLDALGYRDSSGARHYDIYDLQGYGDTNNDLGSRADPAQAQGYSLIVHDAGRSKFYPIPDGSNPQGAKVNQAGWYETWINNAHISEAGLATLWVIGENVVEMLASNHLINTTMGVALKSREATADSLSHLAVQAADSFRWADGDRQLFHGRFYLNAGCPSKRDYDVLDANGQAVVTHRFSTDVQDFRLDGAVVMKADSSFSYNTVMMSFNWFDLLRFPDPYDDPAIELAKQVMFGALQPECWHFPDPPTDVAGNALPRVTRLYQNVPNPFNPRTTIRFDLATQERVSLRVYNVAGRLMRTLLDETLPATRHEVVWDGKDDRGQRVGSGIYFYRLTAGEYLGTRKLVMLK